MKLLSNGFFKNYFVDIDYNEEIQFTEFDMEDEINVLCYNYNFNINDLRDLVAVDENGKIIKNILKDHFITDDEYETIALNYYILYSRKKDEFVVSLCIYDLDLENKELSDFLWKFQKEINIVINTDEEKKYFREKLDNCCQYWSYEDIEDFYSKEYDYYILQEIKEYLVDKRVVIQEIKKVAEKGEWVDENELYNMILDTVRNIKGAF